MGYQTISMHFLDAIRGFKFSYVGANPWSLSGAGGVSCGGCSFACEYRSWSARGSTGKHWETPGLQGTAAQGIFPTNYLPGVTVHYIPSRLSIICIGYHVYRHVMPSITRVSQTKVLVLLWTGYFLLAFLLMAVIARFTGPSRIRNWRVTGLPIKNRWFIMFYLSKIGELPIKNGVSLSSFGANLVHLPLGRCLSNSCWEDFNNFRRRSGRANATAFVGRICCRSWQNSVAFKPSGPCVSHHILIGTALKTPTMPWHCLVHWC